MTRYTGWRPMPPGRYRSRGESYVASMLDRSGLAYRYEPRLILTPPPASGSAPGSTHTRDQQARPWPSEMSNPGTPTSAFPREGFYGQSAFPGAREYWVRPDFYLPRHHAVIEYAGRMDLPDYRLRHREKVQLYEHNGIHCYEVFPEDLRRPYWAPRLIDAIEDCLRPPPGRLSSPGQVVTDTIEDWIHRNA